MVFLSGDGEKILDADGQQRQDFQEEEVLEVGALGRLEPGY